MIPVNSVIFGVTCTNAVFLLKVPLALNPFYVQPILFCKPVQRIPVQSESGKLHQVWCFTRFLVEIALAIGENTKQMNIKGI